MERRFRVLGPVGIEHAGEPIELGRRRERCLLGVLLLEAGTSVPVERLIDLLWDGDPPDAARSALRVHVSRLRSALGPDDRWLIHSAHGYLAQVEPDAVDAHRFRAMVQQASSLGSAPERAESLRRALALWQGPLLADASSQRLRERLGAQWTELRLTALEMAIESELDCGRHREVVAELTTLCGDHPDRERFAGLLMLAQYRNGRQVDAVEVFRRMDRRLRTEFGLEASAQLQELHQRILAADPSLSGDAAATTQAGSTPSVTIGTAAPRQLPADTRAFTGRRAELNRMLELANTAQGPAGTAAIAAIDGMAGIGKTAFAVHIAHRIAQHYPDGQLFADLHGHTQDRQPSTPGEVLEGFLRALGVAAQQIPPTVEQRAALFRHRLADTRTLILLDNADSERQVRPLIPAAAGCLVIVTSRKRLRALDDAHTISLDILPRSDSISLFHAIAGPERLDVGGALPGEIAALCGDLPLALRIAAGLLRTRPGWSPAHLAETLRDHRHRVSRLRDGERDLTGLFSLSCGQLSPKHRRAFALIGLIPGPHLGVRAAASLAGVDPDAARRLLEELVDHNLLAEPTPGRYQQHDLLRLFAADRAAQDLSADERAAALHRLTHYYLRSAHAADAHLTLDRTEVQLPDPAPGCHPERMPDDRTALAWFDAEHPNLLAVQRSAEDRGDHAAVWQLAWTMTVINEIRGHLHDNLAIWLRGLAAAQRLGDISTLSLAHRLLGRAYAYVGRRTESIDHISQALALAKRSGDLSAQAQAHCALTIAWAQRADNAPALDHRDNELRLCQQIPDSDAA